MATTVYFEADFPPPDIHGNANNQAKKTTVEVLVSSFSGTHQIYLRVTNPKGDEQDLVVDKTTANQLLDGLDRAITYLGYDKP